MTVKATIRLLVIEQHRLGESLLTEILNPKDFTIITANSSRAGIHAAQTWNPDLIIINIMQPSMDGWKICRMIRKYSQVPILVLATVSDPNSVARWLDAGADDYLTRPFSSEILIAHLQKLTRRLSVNQNSTLLTPIQ